MVLLSLTLLCCHHLEYWWASWRELGTQEGVVVEADVCFLLQGTAPEDAAANASVVVGAVAGEIGPTSSRAQPIAL